MFDRFLNTFVVFTVRWVVLILANFLGEKMQNNSFTDPDFQNQYSQLLNIYNFLNIRT